MPAGFAGFSSGPSDRRTFLGFLSMHQGVDRRFEWTFMAPVCVRVAFIGGGQGGTFAPGRPVFAAMRLRYGGWDCCEPKRKNCAENMKGLESAH